jgi:hypothetical protein
MYKLTDTATIPNKRNLSIAKYQGYNLINNRIIFVLKGTYSGRNQTNYQEK